MRFPFNIFHFERRASNEDIERAVIKALNDFEAETGVNPTVPIDEKSAVAISAVWACVRIISDAVSILPVHLKMRTEGGRITVKDHPLCGVLRKPSPLMNGVTLRKVLTVSTVLWGNGYARIKRDLMYRPCRIDFLLPNRVDILVSDDDIFYRVDGKEIVPSRDIIHVKGFTFDGIEGVSPIRKHRENLQLTMQAQRFGVNFFQNGCSPTGVFETDKTYDIAAYDRLKRDLYAKHMGLANSAKPLLLEGGLKYKPITIPPEDAQFIATRKFQKTEVATIFGVPPHMIADLERATNNNIEHQSMEFVQHCLMPYIVNMEAEFNDKLLREDEKPEYYHNIAVNGLLRSDSKTRSEFYKNMNLVGALNANEIRDLEDMNGYEGGDAYFVQQNMQTVDNAKNPAISKPQNNGTEQNPDNA